VCVLVSGLWIPGGPFRLCALLGNLYDICESSIARQVENKLNLQRWARGGRHSVHSLAQMKIFLNHFLEYCLLLGKWGLSLLAFILMIIVFPVFLWTAATYLVSQEPVEAPLIGIFVINLAVALGWSAYMTFIVPAQLIIN
jgi:hypothetical protein